MVEEQINSVRRELANLLALGLITSDSSDSTNNKLYYEVNQDYEHFAALQTMFAKAPPEDVVDDKEADKTNEKTKTKKQTKSTKTHATPTVAPTPVSDSVELPEARKWVQAGNLDGIAYSGVYTRDESANADILIIGDANVSKIESIIVGMEKEKNRELRYAIIPTTEWRYRGQVRDKFWLQFMGAKKQIVLDKQNIFKDK